MTHRGVEEVAFEAYNIVYGMLQQDTLVYQHPNKFTARQHELQLKKAGKEVSLDGSGSLTVRDKPQHSTCDTNGELELVQALRRRALAFDLVGVCSYETMNLYHSLLIQRIQDAPPPSYAKVSVMQALRADRAAFTRKGKGAGKGKKGGARLRVPKELIGKWSQNKDGERLCWAYNMQCGCTDAAPGGSCPRGLHLCAEPGCLQPHSLQEHSKKGGS